MFQTNGIEAQNILVLQVSRYRFKKFLYLTSPFGRIIILKHHDLTSNLENSCIIKIFLRQTSAIFCAYFHPLEAI